MIQNRKRCSKVVLKRSISGNFVLKSVQKCAKCDRTSHVQKRAARTHIPHTFQNGFRTHTHTCNRTSHVCVRARTFATYTLQRWTWGSICLHKIVKILQIILRVKYSMQKESSRKTKKNHKSTNWVVIQVSVEL